MSDDWKTEWETFATIDSPIQIEGFEKVKPQKPPTVGGNTMAELKAVGGYRP